MLITGSSQEILKHSMFATIFDWDYPPLHQSFAELVLCGPKVPQLAISNMVDKRLGVCHGIYHGVWDMIPSFYVEHNPVAGSCKGVDFTFHVMRDITGDITQDSQPGTEDGHTGGEIKNKFTFIETIGDLPTSIPAFFFKIPRFLF